jgi:hypothetical protein
VKRIPPSTLRTHLAHNQATGPHPDADLLTAFAEDALIDRERTSVLTHLAACPDCRAIVHTATAAAPEKEMLPEPLPARPPLRNWFAGVALVASLLVMAASTIVFYRTLHTNPAPMQTAATTAAQQRPATPTPQISAATNAALAAAPPAAPKHSRTTPHAPAASPVLQTEEARVGAAAPAPPAPVAGASSSVSLGDLSAQRAQNAPPAEQTQIHAQMQAQITAYRSAMAESKAAPRSSAPASSTESVQVAPSPAFGALRATHPVAGFIPAPIARPRFRITGSGQLERSTQPSIWMPVPIASDAHFRVVSIWGADVWAGGDHLRLFHSADNGLTWTEVQLPATADRIHAIVHIRSDSPQKITVEDNAGSTWTTTDAGATWQ